MKWNKKEDGFPEIGTSAVIWYKDQHGKYTWTAAIYRRSIFSANRTFWSADQEDISNTQIIAWMIPSFEADV